MATVTQWGDPGTTSGGLSNSGTTVAGGSADWVYDFLVSKGLTPAASAGVVGNLQGESGINLDPTIVGDHGTSYGIAQWHNARWTALKTWASNHGLPVGQLSTQAQFLVSELTDTGLWDRIKSMDDPDAVVRLMVTEYERPANPSAAISTRIPYARAVLQRDAPGVWDRIKAGLSDPVGTVTDAAGSALSAGVSQVLSGLGPIAMRGGFVLLGLALAGAGIYTAIRSNEEG